MQTGLANFPLVDHPLNIAKDGKSLFVHKRVALSVKLVSIKASYVCTQNFITDSTHQ